MQPSSNILIGLIFACAFVRLASRVESVRARELKWWQKVMGVVALVFVVLIAANPEFWALGLLGDTAFLDLFVLLMSIQLQMFVYVAWGYGGAVIWRVWHWLVAPSPSLLHLWAACIVANVVSGLVCLWKVFHRMAGRAGNWPWASNLLT